MEEENKLNDLIEAIHRQTYATAQSICATLENGVKNLSARTEMLLPQLPGFKSEVFINITAE